MNEDFINYVKGLIESNGRPNMGRDRFEHSIRVLKMCEQIQQHVGGDIEVLRYAALLHDIGWEKDIPHAEVSFNLAKKILTDIELESSKKDLILKCILNHSNKDNTDANINLEEKILMDADALDESGCLGVIFSSINNYRLSTEVNYKSVLDRIYFDIERYNSKLSYQLHLDYSKSLMTSRISFIEEFCNEMKKELFL